MSRERDPSGNAILYLLAQPLLDLASDQRMRDRDLTARYEERFEVEDSDEWTAVMAEYNREADAITATVFRAQGEAGLAYLYLTDRRGFDRRMERGPAKACCGRCLPWTAASAKW